MLYKIIMTLFTTLLMIIQIGVLYFWLFDWKDLYTELGLLCWNGSILAGTVICIVYFTLLKKGAFSSILKKLVLSSTVMVIVLYLASFVIDFAANSMP